MWFRLGKIYKIDEKDFIGVDRGIFAIGRRAPIHLVFLTTDTNGALFRLSFAYNGYALRNLKLSDLILPEKCVKDGQGNIYCASSKRLFYSYETGGIGIQIVHCPLCGSRVENWPHYPRGERERYEVRLGSMPIFRDINLGKELLRLSVKKK